MRRLEGFPCDVTLGPDGRKEHLGCRGAWPGAVVGLGGAFAAGYVALEFGSLAGLSVGLAAVFSTIVAIRHPRRGRRQVIVLDDQGIKECLVLARSRRTAWTDLTFVRIGESDGVIETTGEPIRIDQSVTGWRRLLRLVAQRLGHEAQGGLTDAELEELLGVPFGTTVGAPGLVPTLSVVSAVVLIATAIATASRGDGGVAWGLLYVALFAILGSVAVPTSVTVTPGGLKQRTRLGLTTLVAWDSVCGTDRTNGQVTIVTDQGRIRLGRATPERLRLAEGIDRLLAARGQGLAPPRLEHLSDAALSPVREIDVVTTIERGLSRSDEA